MWNESDRDSRASRGTRMAIIGIWTNTLLAAAKGIAGVLGNSYALIADAIESSLDIVSSLVVWGGLKISSTPRDVRFPYGYGKAEPLAATVVATGLVVGAITIAIQSISEIITPHHAPEPFTLVVLLVVVITKELLFRSVFKVGIEIDSTAVKGDAWHHRSDALTSTAAFIGITVALVGNEGYESADDWAALFVSAVIAVNGYRIARPAVKEIMDAAPTPNVESCVRAAAMHVDGVLELDKCLIRKMGLGYYVDLHVGVDADLTVRTGHDIAHRVKDAIRMSNQSIIDVLIHIEPVERHQSSHDELHV